MLLSVIIRTYNESRYLGELLQAISRQIIPESYAVETIVVDSGSTDGTIDIARSFGCRITTIEKRDFTFGRSLNIGSDFADGDIFVFVSGHCVPTDDNWLSALATPISNGISPYVYGRQIGRDTTKFSENCHFNSQYGKRTVNQQPGYFCNNANSSIDAKIWRENKYNENLTGLEDIELSTRLISQGHHIAYISEGYSYQFGIYDINDILNPIHLGSIPSFGYAHNAWLNEAGTHLITGEETVGMTVKIWDIQDINNINLVGEYLGENSLAHNVHVKGDFVYISHYTTGLKILDIYDPSDPIEVAAYDTYPDDDSDGFYGCWGAYPFTLNNYIYASDMQYGLFIIEFNEIKAGWVYGIIEGSDGPIGDVEIQSTLNGAIFTSNSNGYYEFGFPEGVQEFDFNHDGLLLDTKVITILPHEAIEHNIYFGNNGDINNDGLLNVLDIVLIVNQILSDEYYESSDINEDGELNILDIVQLVNLILG